MFQGCTMPVFSNSVESNFEVLQAALQGVNAFNAGGAMLRLFKNNFQPTYASLLSDFLEANFTGYVPVALAGQFPTPRKQIDGLYACTTPSFTFTNAGGSAQVLYGFYVSKGTNWYFGAAFPSPVILNPGGTLPFILTWQAAAIGLAF